MLLYIIIKYNSRTASNQWSILLAKQYPRSRSRRKRIFFDLYFSVNGLSNSSTINSLKSIKVSLVYPRNTAQYDFLWRFAAAELPNERNLVQNRMNGKANILAYFECFCSVLWFIFLKWLLRVSFLYRSKNIYISIFSCIFYCMWFCTVIAFL